jgi:hypothetical protein
LNVMCRINQCRDSASSRREVNCQQQIDCQCGSAIKEVAASFRMPWPFFCRVMFRDPKKPPLTSCGTMTTSWEPTRVAGLVCSWQVTVKNSRPHNGRGWKEPVQGAGSGGKPLGQYITRSADSAASIGESAMPRCSGKGAMYCPCQTIPPAGVRGRCSHPGASPGATCSIPFEMRSEGN